MVFHCLLSCIVFYQKSAVTPILIPLGIAFFSFLATFAMFSFSLILSNLIMMYLGIVFSMFHVLGFTEILCDIGFTVFNKFGETGPLVFQIFFSVPSAPLGTQITCILGNLKFPHSSLAPYLFFFSICVLFWIVSIVLCMCMCSLVFCNF